MQTKQLVMVLHGHQPVGNLDHVFEKAYDQCYLPVLQATEQCQAAKLAIHLSGSLLEWLADNRPRFLTRLAKLVEGERIEILGGAMYEAVLPVIPESDAIAQIEIMNETLQQHFGITPRGCWLAERIWEPALAGLLSRIGFEYTLVDQVAFCSAGLCEPERIAGYWVTEQAGDTLALFPIDQRLRCSIPFEPVETVLKDVQHWNPKADGCLVYADDMEKFGLWPNTYETVIERGWLADFLLQIERSDWLELAFPSQLLDSQPTQGRIYLPTAAYDEMQVWSELQQAAHPDQKTQVGPVWQNFMVKYPQANQLHKKMLLVSRKLQEALSDEEPWEADHEQARRALYRSQCNCAYWHGIHGGIYLPHLRDAVYQNLIHSETILDRRVQGEEDWISFDQLDFDCDLQDEIIAENAHMNLYIDPSQGGVVTELDSRPHGINLTNVMTRRSELPLFEKRLLDSNTPAASIHDQHQRFCFVDRFLPFGTTLADLVQGSAQELGDFIEKPYQIEQIGIDEQGECDFELTLVRQGNICYDSIRSPLTIQKHFRMPPDEAYLELTYRLHNPTHNPLDVLFCPELNLHLPWAASEHQFIDYETLQGPEPRLQAVGEAHESGWFCLSDLHRRVRINLDLMPSCGTWYYPIETSSRSPSGFERIYQGTAIAPYWECTIPAGASYRMTIKLSILSLEDDCVIPLTDTANQGD